MNFTHSGIALAFAFALGLPTLQDGVKGTATDRFTLDAGAHEILDVIHKSGAFLGRTYLLDKQQAPTLCTTNDPGNKIEIATDISLDAEGCEEWVGQVLYAKGWVATPLDIERGLYDWIFVAGPKSASIRSHARQRGVDEILARPKVVEYVTTVVKMEHIDAQYASSNLRQIFNDPRSMMNVLPLGRGETQTIALTGFRHEVARMISLIREADVPQKPMDASLEQRLAELEARIQSLENGK